jgi:hypothetical protein
MLLCQLLDVQGEDIRWQGWTTLLIMREDVGSMRDMLRQEANLIRIGGFDDTLEGCGS